jgi:two-component system cell cycle sensor histidine kinase/response regulator CckA
MASDLDAGSTAPLAAAEVTAEIERPAGEHVRVGLKVRPLGRRAGPLERARLVSIRPRGEIADADLLTAEARHFAGLGRFLAGAAHDCSNLLTPLLGYCELILAKLPEDSPLIGYAREIERSARLAAELMHRLRDTARNQPVLGGTVLPDRCLIDLAGLLRSLVGSGIELVEDLRAGELEVPVRAGEIEQIVLNLAANARDAMPLGGRLTLRSRAEEGPSWILEIEDSGGGITPENLGRLFDPAFTTKAVGKGTGLGLWIVRSIVERAGGTVGIRSALGHGTTVRVEIPAKAVVAGASTPVRFV